MYCIGHWQLSLGKFKLSMVNGKLSSGTIIYFVQQMLVLNSQIKLTNIVHVVWPGVKQFQLF